jgi:hypothetical protein
MSKRSSPDSVIDLTSSTSNDKNQAYHLGGIRNFLAYKPGGGKKKAKKEQGDASAATVGRIKTEGSPSAAAAAAASEVHYDDVEVVEASTRAIAPAETIHNAANDWDDDDVVMVGTINEMRLPHMRHDCVKFKFNQNPTNRHDIRAKNWEHCDLCYCYVCDVPVKECKVSTIAVLYFLSVPLHHIL